MDSQLKRWRNCGWRKYPDRALYHHYELVNLISVNTGHQKRIVACNQLRESGLRENCTIRLFERTEGGCIANLFRLYTNEAVITSRGEGKGLSQSTVSNCQLGTRRNYLSMCMLKTAKTKADDWHEP